jgi:hypothetical protein
MWLTWVFTGVSLTTSSCAISLFERLLQRAAHSRRDDQGVEPVVPEQRPERPFHKPNVRRESRVVVGRQDDFSILLEEDGGNRLYTVFKTGR